MIGKWVSKLERLPSMHDCHAVASYFYVRRHDPDRGWIIGVRYFDDSNSSWWLPGNKGFTPNNSFDEWHQIEHHGKPETDTPARPSVVEAVEQ